MRLRSGALIPILLAGLATPAATDDSATLSNLDFESGSIGSVPPGWMAGGALRRGYQVMLTERDPHGGHAAALIRRDSVTRNPDHGALEKRIDARPYRGRRVKVAGWLRFELARPGLGRSRA